MIYRLGSEHPESQLAGARWQEQPFEAALEQGLHGARPKISSGALHVTGAPSPAGVSGAGIDERPFPCKSPNLDNCGVTWSTPQSVEVVDLLCNYAPLLLILVQFALRLTTRSGVSIPDCGLHQFVNGPYVGLKLTLPVLSIVHRLTRPLAWFHRTCAALSDPTDTSTASVPLYGPKA